MTSFSVVNIGWDTSLFIDKPRGRVHMDKIISSKVSPKNKATSKAEYTNTQQDLPVNGYNLVHLTRYARLFG